MNICPMCYRTLSVSMNKVFCQNCEWSGMESSALNEYTVVDIEMDRIYSDADFNCRGTIMPIDVVDLVKDIEQHGLQFPIAVQPAFDTGGLPEGYDFRIVAGHRRHAAFRVAERTKIPCMIKVGLTEVQARLVNLGENLKRKALDITQEAHAIKHLKDLGLNRRQTSEALGVSMSWVQVRYNLLDLPQEIQDEAASGLLNQYQIKEIYGLKVREQQFEAVKKIKDARLRGEKGVSVGKSVQSNPFKKKRQPKNVVQEMIDHMGETVGYGLHTRVLAWANGEISAADVYFDIRAYAEVRGIDYEIPIAGVGALATG
jgi:ParB/RepB/Spo0J family partition protein